VRLKAVDAIDIPPVKHFAVSDLADVIVLAGPNGVGKTRLIEKLLQTFQSPLNNKNVCLEIEATCEEERLRWEQNTLKTATAEEANKLMQTLQRNRQRTRWQSGVFQFESDRTIKPYQNYPFSFDTTDPWDEQLGWNSTFGFLRDRFQDTLHSIFRKTQSRRDALGKKAEQLLRAGSKSMELDGFPDPLLPFKDAFTQLLGPKQLVEADVVSQQLFYEYNNTWFPVTSLSSGEREVLAIVFDFIMRNPSDSIVFFDEPELHLHPELSFRLIQTLRNVGRRNQFVFCTHSADIISSSLDNTVVFLAPPKDGEGGNQAIVVREDDDTHQALKLLGQSIGIISLGKKLVLIEGTQGSLDKQTYGSILKNRFPNLVLVPSGGKGIIASFATLMEHVLERTMWGVQFFMLCDRDVIPLSRQSDEIEAAGHGRVKMLTRYHLENYFLDEHILAAAFDEMEPAGSPFRSPATIETMLRDLASSTISHAATLIVASEYRERVGNLDIKPKACDNKSADELIALFANRVETEKSRINGAIDAQTIAASVKETMMRLEQSLEDGTWKDVIPGRPVFNMFAAKAKLTSGRLKLLYLGKAATQPANPFQDIISIFEHFGKS
jgi:ABC-type cobalamin/Fe3+-siderophores transport system ATPase subunit